jgi:osmoprotectant transport system ATP-binding protein
MIRLDNLTKTFATDRGTVMAVDHVNLEVPEGEICILLGPSGCGKTTTLKMVNRLIMPTSGKIYIDDKDTDEYDPVQLRRNIGYVIQQIGLFPNMTIEENISLVPDLLGWEKERARKRAHELLEMVALDPDTFLRRYPSELSGGQQQRVGVIRALAADAPVMLMDEPFGAIDPINREIIQDEFLKMQSEIRKTIMFVSHDIDEAVKMGDKVAIFREGRLEQYASPDDLLANPVNEFVADFVGSDRTLKRLRLARVEDAMMPSAPTVGQDDTLERAKGLILDSGQRAVVMTDRRGRPKGYIDLNQAESGIGKVAESYSPLVGTVRLSDDLRTAVSQMFTYNVDWLAVVDGEGRFRGYVTQHGITQLLGETYVREPEEA